VADMPLLEVESIRAGSTCCKTCSKERVARGNGGVFLLPASGWIFVSEIVQIEKFVDRFAVRSIVFEQSCLNTNSNSTDCLLCDGPLL